MQSYHKWNTPFLLEFSSIPFFIYTQVLKHPSLNFPSNYFTINTLTDSENALSISQSREEVKKKIK